MQLLHFNHYNWRGFNAFADPNRSGRKNDPEWLKAMRAAPFVCLITVAYKSLVKLDD